MRRLFALLMSLALISPAQAGERVWLGKARIFTNDKIGDGRDRWRTGSYSLSRIRGSAWTGQLPDRLFALTEYRVRTEIIAPDNLMNPIIGTDRRYAGTIWLGAHSHSRLGAAELTLGGDLVFVGPGTGLGDFQSMIHNALGMGQPQVLGSQLPNAVYPTATVELARTFPFEGNNIPGSFRPFLEAQIGVETYARIGFDLALGPASRGNLSVRDVVTGTRNIAVKSQRGQGTTWILGADIAFVNNSNYLPASLGYTVTAQRTRVRTGFVYEGQQHSMFYGLTWLGPEFQNQNSGQVVGAVTIRMRF